MRYVPILKARRAELGALATQQVTTTTEPVFEFQTAVWNQNGKGKSMGADVAAFIDALRRQWWKPAFVDLSRVASTPAERSSWWALIQALVALPGVPAYQLAPVFTNTDTTAVLNNAHPLAQSAGKALLRVQAPYADIPGLAQLHHDIASAMNLPVSAVEVLIDWSDSTENHSLDSMENHVQAIISALPTGVPAIIAGTPDTTACTQSGQWDLIRREWWLWLRLHAQNLDVDFGDYALLPPPTPGWGRPTYGHLRYSVNDELHVERQLASTGGLGDGFKMCCDNLVALHKFAGPTFSLGDTTIDDIVHRGTTPPGGAEAWRRIALQHHLCLVDQQLASPPAAPPAGTA